MYTTYIMYKIYTTYIIYKIYPTYIMYKIYRETRRFTQLEFLASAVRETPSSRHNEGPIEGPLKPPRYHSAVMFGRVSGGHNGVPMMP